MSDCPLTLQTRLPMDSLAPQPGCLQASHTWPVQTQLLICCNSPPPPSTTNCHLPPPSSLSGHITHPFPYGLQSPRVILDPSPSLTQSVPTQSQIPLAQTSKYYSDLITSHQPLWAIWENPSIFSLITNFLLYSCSNQRDLLTLLIRPHQPSASNLFL